MRGRAVVAAVCAAVAALSVLPSAASARMTWSGPRPIGPSNGHPVTLIACPSVHQCTALDGLGALTFDPASSLPSVDRSLPAEENGLACPLTTLCTAVTDGGRELSFDPERPAALRSRSLGRLYQPSDVACPSSRECVTVGDGAEVGTEVAYDPLTGGRVGHRFRDPDAFTFTGGLACPTRTECVALDDLNELAITFSPLTGNGVFYPPAAARSVPRATRPTPRARAKAPQMGNGVFYPPAAASRVPQTTHPPATHP